ncbi:MAG: ribosomal-protein-alanine N-acetyltransferase [Francisella sp.]|jgi:ribosomal-protein-alanine N-acetyltransferase
MQISKLTDNFYSQTIKLIRTTDSRLNWSDKQIFESFGDNHLVFGYIESGRLVAIAIFSYVLDTSELLYICVDKSIQSKGVANKLLSQSILKLKKVNISEIFLEVDTQNIPAISLYKKLNFKQISMRKNYYQYKNGDAGDALIYRLDI